VPDEAWTALSEALAADGDAYASFAAVETLLGDPSLNAITRPDPFGFAVLMAPRYAHSGYVVGLSSRDTNDEDTFTPRWQPRITWPGVPLSDDTRILVELWDEDVDPEDLIGVAEISAVDLTEALEAKEPYPVEVADQTNNQLLFLKIAVRKRVSGGSLSQ
jgi:hypothetical protein